MSCTIGGRIPRGPTLYPSYEWLQTYSLPSFAEFIHPQRILQKEMLRHAHIISNFDLSWSLDWCAAKPIESFYVAFGSKSDR